MYCQSHLIRLLGSRIIVRSRLVPSTPRSRCFSSSSLPDNKIIRRTVETVKYTALIGASAGLGVILLGGLIFIHDAFTYTDRHCDRVPVSPLALNPEVGGPKVCLDVSYSYVEKEILSLAYVVYT
jgi:hypothetical protein